MAKTSTHSRFKLDKAQKKIIIYILGIVLPLFIFSLYFIQNTASTELAKFSEQKASHLDTKIILEIERYLENTSTFTEEAASMLRLYPDNYTAVLPFLKKHVRGNPHVYGSALAIEPTSPLYTMYCKYFYEHNRTVREKWLMPPTYDYLHKAWYSRVKKTKTAMWSQPYFDTGGGEVYMSTFSFPLLDTNNTFFGVITADIEIKVLLKKIQKITFSKESFAFILDRKGFLLSHPDEHYMLKKTAFDYAKSLGSKTLSDALKQILKTDRGSYTITIGPDTYTLYSSTVPNSDLKIVVFLKNALIYKPLNDLKQKLALVISVGTLLILLMLILILQKFKQNIVKRTKLKNELDLAKQIQMSFLPKQKDLLTETFEIHAYLQAARDVGGDLYGYKEFNTHIVFYVGDVSGKGIPAALFMMAGQIVLKNSIDTTSDPATIITRTNNRLLEISQNGMFMTLLVAKYDFVDKTLIFCNAGHPSFIIKSKFLFSPIPTRHPPINIFNDTHYTNNTLLLEEPFQLICFSDGVSEAETVKKELFGIERVAQSLAKDFNLYSLRKEIDKFVKENPQNDDITIVTFCTLK